MRAGSITLCFMLAALSCTPRAFETSLQTSLYIYRFDPPAFVQFSADFQTVREVPFAVPLSCELFNAFAPPVGGFLAVELSCPSGQTVLFLETSSGRIAQPITETDAHFLAWDNSGTAAYLKVDSLGNTRILRVWTNGRQDSLPVTGWTYDLSPRPGSQDFTFTFSRGLGYGSEMHLAERAGRSTRQLHADPYNYISFARWSPDGRQIAFIKIPDTQTPFTVGGLWIMDADGSNARKLADVDAGHGYAANWSPDGERIAFVVRENAGDADADQSADALISNIYAAEVESGRLQQITNFEKARVETPLWSPDGNSLAFNVVMDGRMQVWIADMLAGEVRPLLTEPACCPAWIRGK